MTDLDDGALARAAASGDKAAFAAIYDRYADRLHDFCVGMLRDRDTAADCVQDVFVTAATRLVQLREPDRLRSWLYAIARNEALARIRARKREQPSEELPDMPSGDADLATLAARNELADLIHAASGGLTDRDRTVLELAYRRRLDGPELADALGVTPRNANTLVERMRDTIARSLGALLVCRRVKADPERCPELAAILDGWDGQLTVLMRKRVARHIDDCSICEEDRARMVSSAVLLGSAPALIPAPKWLRDQTLSKVRLGGPPPSVPATDANQSWWPQPDFDVSDLEGSPASASASPAKPRGNGVRAGVGAALVLLAIGGAIMVRAPANLRVVPAVAPSTSTTTATDTTTSITTTTTIEPSTTEPSAVPRIAPPETSPPPPAPVPEPLPPSTTTTRRTTQVTSTPATTTPVRTTEPRTTEPRTTEPTKSPVTSAPPEVPPSEPSTTKPTKPTLRPPPVDTPPTKQQPPPSSPVCPGDPQCPPIFT
jgi:RNA polymerase sigma factor (sigma-70 family)